MICLTAGWKGASGVFERGDKKAPEVDEEQLKDLHTKIGEPAIANDYCHDSSRPRGQK